MGDPGLQVTKGGLRTEGDREQRTGREGEPGKLKGVKGTKRDRGRLGETWTD